LRVQTTSNGLFVLRHHTSDRISYQKDMDFATTKLPRTFKSANQSITEPKKEKKKALAKKRKEKKKQQILLLSILQRITNTKGLFGMAF